MTEEENTNWDEELENLTSVGWEDQTGMSPEEARFNIVIRKLEAVFQEWADTEVYATVPEDADPFNATEITVDVEPFEDSFKTSLGDVAAVPMLGVIASIMSDILKADEGVPTEETLREYRVRIVEAVKALMVEGVLVSKSPTWADKFDDATVGLN